MMRLLVAICFRAIEILVASFLILWPSSHITRSGPGLHKASCIPGEEHRADNHLGGAGPVATGTYIYLGGAGPVATGTYIYLGGAGPVAAGTYVYLPGRGGASGSRYIHISTWEGRGQCI